MVVWLCGVLLKKHIDIEAYLGTLAMTRERRINMIKTIQPPCRLGTTFHPSATLTPSPFGTRLTPLNLASLEELHLLSRLRRQLPRGEAFRLACFPIRHTWRLYDFYIRAFRFQGVPWPFSSAAAICTIKNHVEREINVVFHLISSLFLPAIPAEMTQQVSAQIKIALTIK